MSRYKDNIAAGCCGMCGKVRPTDNPALCDQCKTVSRERSATRRKKSKENGNCSSCNARPKEPGKSKCAQCLSSAAASARRQQHQRKLSGICQACGKQPPIPDKTICQPCSDRMTITSTTRYHDRRAAGKCNYCDNDPVPGSTMCQHHLDSTKQQRADLKLEVMNAYGGPKCSWCSETDMRYLEIDHINGGGRHHVKTIKAVSGHGLRSWLKANNFPPGFRVLCRTCNNKAHVEKCRENDTLLTQNHGITEG